MAPNMAMPERKPGLRRANHGLAKSPSGTTGSAARRSTTTKKVSSTTGQPEQPQHRGPPPRSSASGLDEADQKRRDGRREDTGAGEVEGGTSRHHALAGQPPLDGGHGKQTERQVDVEDRAPRHGVGQEPADERAHQRSYTPGGREIALHLGTALEPVEVGDDGHADGDEGPGAEPLDGAKHDELGHALGEPGQR
jgi:hypothetical protein